MIFVFFLALGVSQYTIYEHCDRLDQILQKDLVHHIHIVGWSISLSKRHHCILVRTIPQNEGSLQKVTFSYLRLILSQLKIYFREDTHTTELTK
jgi:hypothetical protein